MSPKINISLRCYPDCSLWCYLVNVLRSTVCFRLQQVVVVRSSSGARYRLFNCEFAMRDKLHVYAAEGAAWDWDVPALLEEVRK